MFSIEMIRQMNRDAGKAAKGRLPYVAKCDRDEDVFHCPNFGDYMPKGWKLVKTLFVDNSGFGGPAVSIRQFIAGVKNGYGYAIIEERQFQVYIGVFEKIVKTVRTTNRCCHRYLDERKPFKANNLSGSIEDNGVYVVWSYGRYPIFVYSDGLWYENAEWYSRTTKKQMNQARPIDGTIVTPNDEMQIKART